LVLLEGRKRASLYPSFLPDLGTVPKPSAVSESGVGSIEPVEKVIFCRLIKNAQMQGARNPEE